MDYAMNEETKKLFELIDTCQTSDETIDYSTLYEKVKALISDGANINALNELGFNVLQVIMEVKSPEMSLTSTYKNEDWSGYYSKAWYIDACLRNGFLCSKEELTLLLKNYCTYESLNCENNSPQLICTLLEKGADWNCKDYNEEYGKELSILDVILGLPINYHLDTDSPNATDWRYKMLCAYKNAGGNLYIKNQEGKYFWETTSLSLTALAFLLEQGIEIYTKDVESCFDEIIEFFDYHNLYNFIDYLAAIDTGYSYPYEDSRIKSIINTLLDNADKYHCIFEYLPFLAPIFWDANFDATFEDLKATDYYKNFSIFLQEVKARYGNLQKALDGAISMYCKRDKEPMIGKFLNFALADFPEIADYFPWEKLDHEAWCYVLYDNPQFAGKYDKWNTLSEENDFAGLADCINLQTIPHLPLEELSPYGWYCVLLKQPKLANKCHKINDIPKQDWKYLLKEYPELKEYRK
jgi:hypothetical protein